MTTPLADPPIRHFYYVAIAGLIALFVGIGLCRFAYTPLIPNLISEGWFTKSQTAYLGAMNFLGYLIGVFLGYQLSKYFKLHVLVKSSLIVSAISLAMSAIHLGFLWFALWRFVAGVTGAFLMVLTPALILKNIPPDYKGRISGIIFTGIGLGIVVSGFLFPSLAKINMIMAWLGASVLAIIASFIAWPGLSIDTSLAHDSSNNHSDLINTTFNHLTKSQFRIFTLLSIIYALVGIGIVPHMLFLVDYIHQKLGLNMVISGLFWAAFGVGSLMGSLWAGIIADRIGTYKSLIITFFIACVAASMVLFNKIDLLYFASAFLMGAALPGMVTLISSRIVELVGTENHPIFWGKITLYLAITQALGAYGMSYLLHRGVDYTICFMIADIALVMGLVLVKFTGDTPVASMRKEPL